MKHRANMAVPVSCNCDCTIERLSLAHLRQRFNELVDFCGGVIKMRGDPEAITARCGDDVSLIEVAIKRHRRKTATMANTNNLRLLTGRSRAHDVIVLIRETFAKIIRQFLKIVCDLLDTIAL